MPITLINPNLKLPTVTGPRTEIKSVDCCNLELVRREGNGLNGTAPARPPWYVVRYRGLFWDSVEWCYIWQHYAGPPKVFLTRKFAEKEAKSFRKQYGGGGQYGNGPLKVEVVKIEL